jgi:hypothetical protein
LSGAAFVGAFLVPKCPLCVAAWAATLGLGAAGQHYLLNWFDSRYRPALIGLLMLPLLLQVGFTLRRVRAKSRRMRAAARGHLAET